MKRNQNIEAVIVLILLGGVTVWLALVLAKMYGSFPGVSWVLLGCGIVWIPCALVCAVFGAVWLVELPGRIRELDMKLHTYRTLKDAMHGMTLNTIGPVYGVERQAGEPNWCYERRILAKAAEADKIRLKRTTPTPGPATGEKLDKIAKKHGLTRFKNESDKHLQARVREAITRELDKKLEGGKA